MSLEIHNTETLDNPRPFALLEQVAAEFDAGSQKTNVYSTDYSN